MEQISPKLSRQKGEDKEVYRAETASRKPETQYCHNQGQVEE